MEFAIIVVAVIALIGFRLWLQHRRRLLIHRERLTAIEKGVELPQLDQDLRRNNARIQRFLLLGGLIWISLGFGVFVFFTAILAHPQQEIPRVSSGAVRPCADRRLALDRLLHEQK